MFDLFKSRPRITTRDLTASDPTCVRAAPIPLVLSGPHYGLFTDGYTDLVAVATNAHEEVIGFDIPVYEVFVVDKFDPSNHLKKQYHAMNYFTSTSNKGVCAEIKYVVIIFLHTNIFLYNNKTATIYSDFNSFLDIHEN